MSHWQFGSRAISLERPRVMAVLNATPDSFYAGSRLPGISGPTVEDRFGATMSRDGSHSLRQRLKAILVDRPDIVDVGGQSARPGSLRVSVAEELERVLPVIQTLRELAPELPISVDTYSAEVARRALAAGADAVNDISAGRLDPDLFGVVAESGCGYVLMHMQGQPETMQREPFYDDCLREVHEFLQGRLNELLELGVDRERIAVDPGIGFGKRLEDNLTLISRASRFHSLGQPLLYGVSRKSFIAALPQVNQAATEADGRLPASLGASWALLEQGVMLHRTHDPGPMRQLFALWQALKVNERLADD